MSDILNNSGTGIEILDYIKVDYSLPKWKTIIEEIKKNYNDALSSSNSKSEFYLESHLEPEYSGYATRIPDGTNKLKYIIKEDKEIEIDREFFESLTADDLTFLFDERLDQNLRNEYTDLFSSEITELKNHVNIGNIILGVADDNISDIKGDSEPTISEKDKTKAIKLLDHYIGILDKEIENCEKELGKKKSFWTSPLTHAAKGVVSEKIMKRCIKFRDELEGRRREIESNKYPLTSLIKTFRGTEWLDYTVKNLTSRIKELENKITITNISDYPTSRLGVVNYWVKMFDITKEMYSLVEERTRIIFGEDKPFFYDNLNWNYERGCNVFSLIRNSVERIIDDRPWYVSKSTWNSKYSVINEFSKYLCNIQGNIIAETPEIYQKSIEGGEKLKKDVKPSYKMDVLKFFKNVKLITMESAGTYFGRIEPYLKALKDAKDMGQTALVQRLLGRIILVKYESILKAYGFDKRISERQLVDFVKKTEKGVSLCYVSNFGRPIPNDVIEKKVLADKLHVFDNYCILHYDPEKKSYQMTVEERERERIKKNDPILFGILRGSRDLYYIADWIDETCDLTLDKFIKTLDEKEENFEIGKVKV